MQATALRWRLAEAFRSVALPPLLMAPCLLAWVLLARHPTHDAAGWRGFAGALVMTIAMMLPFAADGLRHVVFRSFASRRRRAAAGFLLGYLGACALAAGALVLALRAQQGLAPRWPAGLAAAGVLVLAAAWQRTPLRARLLAACHRTLPLEPLGWRADRDVAASGWRIGRCCALVCWPTMLAPMFGVASLALMVGGFLLAVAERTRLRPGSSSPGVALLAAAAACALLALDGGLVGALGEICASRR